MPIKMLHIEEALKELVEEEELDQLSTVLFILECELRESDSDTDYEEVANHLYDAREVIDKIAKENG